MNDTTSVYRRYRANNDIIRFTGIAIAPNEAVILKSPHIGVGIFYRQSV